MGPAAAAHAVGAAVVVEERAPRRLFDAFQRALREGRPVAVLDGRWPPPLRAQARELVARAQGLRPRDLVVFTSGSGGRPRAVHRGLASWTDSIEPFAQILDLRADDVTWLPGHPVATASLFAAWHAQRLGLPARFAGEERRDATVVHAVPSLVPGLLRARREGGLPRLRLVVTVGDRVPDSLAAQCAAHGVRLVAYYGAAELAFVAIRDDDRPGYRPFPGVELAVRDGLLWSRSPYQAHGYLDAADPGSGRGGPLRRDADGWASVGDHARIVESDRSGPRVEILGRADAAVTVSGHTVLVEDVEAVLREVEGVDDVVVTGVPDRVHGQRLVALWSGSATAPLARAAATLPTPARPRSRHHVAELPRTSFGKPDRAAARRLAERLQADGAASPRQAVSPQVAAPQVAASQGAS